MDIQADQYSLPLLLCSVYSSSQLFQVSLFWGQLNETRPLFIPELVFRYDHVWALTAVQVHVLLGSAVRDWCLRSLLWGSLLRSGLGISFLSWWALCVLCFVYSFIVITVVLCLFLSQTTSFTLLSLILLPISLERRDEWVSVWCQLLAGAKPGHAVTQFYLEDPAGFKTSSDSLVFLSPCSFISGQHINLCYVWWFSPQMLLKLWVFLFLIMASYFFIVTSLILRR